MMSKLICLMPTYNKEKTLAKAIESVMMQKTDYSYKLIILDDCSTDNSNKIAHEYRNKYPNKIEIVRNEENLKLLKTITKGYSLLKGADYFCVLDADDWYIYDKKFDDAIKFLEKNKDFSMYMTNINLMKKDSATLWINTKDEYKDFNIDEYHSGKGFFVQTTGVIYRNIYFKYGMNEKFIQATYGKYGELLRADGFRHEWYLHGGKAHFVNHVESIYNWNEEGIYASLVQGEQNLLNTKLYLAFADFFENKQEYYLNKARNLYNSTMISFAKLEKEKYSKCIKDIVDLHIELFIKNPTEQKEQPIVHTKDKYSLLEQIFSIKNSKDEKHKVITILGIKIKFWRIYA